MGQRALREYGVGAQILLDLGVRDMILMSSMTSTPAAIDGYGLKIVGRVPVPTED
jgi:3,4-dihydroxy 2-butanone 4-phosphate synthase/GTP cyclohydrolase II